MEINVIKENTNPLFSRKEVEVLVIHDVTPTNEEAKKIISDKFSCDSNLVRIIKISSKFGSRKSIIYADIYSSPEEFKLLVRKTKKEIEAEKKEIEAKKAEEETKKVEESDEKIVTEDVKEQKTEEKTE